MYLLLCLLFVSAMKGKASRASLLFKVEEKLAVFQQSVGGPEKLGDLLMGPKEDAYKGGRATSSKPTAIINNPFK